MIAFRAQHRGIYIGLLIVSIFLFVAAIGPGLFSTANPNPFAWQYLLFDLLCHQDPTRSFYIGGNQLAVCTRCFGIYTSFLFGVLIIPAIDYFSNHSKKVILRLFLVSIFINIADVSGNYLEFWTNTLNSRFLLGCLVGLTAALILTNTFFITTKSEDEDGS